MAQDRPEGNSDAAHPQPPEKVVDPRSYKADGAYDGPKEGDDDEDKGKSGDEGKDDEKDKKEKKPGPFQKPAVLIGAGVVLALLILAAVLFWLHARNFQSTDDAFVDTHIVHLAPQIAGRVYWIQANDNAYVAPGQVLVRIDPVDVNTRVQEARAQRASAVAQREQALAQKVSAGAQVRVARRNAEQSAAQVPGAEAQARSAAADYARYSGLHAVNPLAVAGQQLDNSRAQAAQTASQAQAARKAAAAAAAQVDQARTQLATADAQIAAADAQIAQADAQLASAGTNASYAEIRAPVAGHVTKRTVALGAYVQAGQELMAITPTELWVTANFKETQLKLMRAGQPVDIKVDAYPDVKFRGHVESIQRGAGQAFAVLPSENATGNFVKVVQRVPVKIDIDNLDDAHHPLGPGMSVTPKVRVR